MQRVVRQRALSLGGPPWPCKTVAAQPVLLLPYKIARCWCRSILSPSLDQIFNFFSKLHAEKSGEYYYSRIVLGVTPPFTPTGVGGGHFLVSPLFVLFSYVSPSKADILNQPMKTSQIFVSSPLKKRGGWQSDASGIALGGAIRTQPPRVIIFFWPSNKD